MDLEEIKRIFMNANLIENYNFLEEDLITLSNAFLSAGAKKERQECIEFVRSLNSFVGQKLEEKRGEL